MRSSAGNISLYRRSLVLSSFLKEQTLMPQIICLYILLSDDGGKTGKITHKSKCDKACDLKVQLLLLTELDA